MYTCWTLCVLRVFHGFAFVVVFVKCPAYNFVVALLYLSIVVQKMSILPFGPYPCCSFSCSVQSSVIKGLLHGAVFLYAYVCSEFLNTNCVLEYSFCCLVFVKQQQSDSHSIINSFQWVCFIVKHQGHKLLPFNQQICQFFVS